MEISKAKIKVSSIFTVRKHVRSTRYHTMCSGLPYAFGTQNDTDWCINVESGETWHRLLIWVKYRLASLDRIVKSSPSTAASFVCLFIFSSSIFFFSVSFLPLPVCYTFVPFNARFARMMEGGNEQMYRQTHHRITERILYYFRCPEAQFVHMFHASRWPWRIWVCVWVWVWDMLLLR